MQAGRTLPPSPPPVIRPLSWARKADEGSPCGRSWGPGVTETPARLRGGGGGLGESEQQEGASLDPRKEDAVSIPVLLQGKLRHGEISSLPEFSGVGFPPRRSHAQVHEQHGLHPLGHPAMCKGGRHPSFSVKHPGLCAFITSEWYIEVNYVERGTQVWAMTWCALLSPL